ncbi:hypothetical protein HanIR_Chr11g0517571 [Helianthus annuus]|nr:hypothetical protein HanIR_Chr11g0517571 [Helianthus annuus]
MGPDFNSLPRLSTNFTLRFLFVTKRIVVFVRCQTMMLLSFWHLRINITRG